RQHRSRATSRFFRDRHRHVTTLAFAVHNLEGDALRCRRNALGNRLLGIHRLAGCLYNDISRDDSLLLSWAARGDGSNERAFYILRKLVLLAQLSRQRTDLHADPRGILCLYRTSEWKHDNCKNAHDYSRKWTSR